MRPSFIFTSTSRFTGHATNSIANSKKGLTSMTQNMSIGEL